MNYKMNITEERKEALSYKNLFLELCNKHDDTDKAFSDTMMVVTLYEEVNSPSLIVKVNPNAGIILKEVFKLKQRIEGLREELNGILEDYKDEGFKFLTLEEERKLDNEPEPEWIKWADEIFEEQREAEDEAEDKYFNQKISNHRELLNGAHNYWTKHFRTFKSICDEMVPLEEEVYEKWYK